MAFPLDDFEKHASAAVLQRAQAYLAENRISKLTQTGDRVEARVSGSEFYRVWIDLEDTQIGEWHCECPYDQGGMCKHVAAVLYALRGGAPTFAKPAEDEEPLIDRLLNRASGEALRDFLARQIELDKNLRSAFISHFGGEAETPSVAHYRSVIREIIRSVGRDRYGMIGYHQAAKLGNNLLNLLNGTPKEDMAATAALCQALIPLLAPKFNRLIDDSSGLASQALNTAFDRLQSVLEATTTHPKLRKELFRFALRESGKKSYHGWDWEYDLFDLAVRAADAPKEVKALMEALDNRLAALGTGKQGFSSAFMLRRIALLKYRLLERSGDAAAEDYLQAHLAYDDFREIALERAWSREDYALAEQLIRDGIALAREAGHHGNQMRWEQQLARHWDKTGQQDLLLDQYQQLFLANPARLEYFHALKEHAPPADFSQRVEQILENLRTRKLRHGNTAFFSSDLAEVLRIEGRWDELMDEVAKTTHLSTLDQYYRAMGKKFADRFLPLYAAALDERMDRQADRNTYRECVRYLRQMRKMGGQDLVNHLVEDWRRRYPRRKALLEELDRL